MFDSLKNILFVDIETVAKTNTFEELDEDFKKLWTQQVKQSYKELVEKESPSSLWTKKAALHPEFGKIITLSMGYLIEENKTLTLKVKTLSGEEVDILKNFANILALKEEKGGSRFYKLCGHNAKKFDFPYLFRRYLINKLSVPETLNLIGKKPWESSNIDTMELWSSNSYPSLDLLCKLLDIPMKSILEGSQIHEHYYVLKDQNTINKYCAADVVAVSKVLLKIFEVEVPISNVVFS